MIEIRQLEKGYGGQVKALQGVDLTINTGMFGLVGPNGAGKTTLMRLVAGLLQPDRGSITVFGHDLATRQGKLAAKAILGYLPQDLGLYPNLTGREFLDYIAILKGITDRQRRKQQIDELLETVRLENDADKRLKTYSGGMKRRVGIAQVLLGQPKLLIVDEPTVGLDPEERVRFRNLLSTLAARCTVILSTHIIEDISHSCQQLAVMNRGRLLFCGPPSDLMSQARGHVWSLVTAGEPPDDSLAVVSTMQLQQGVQYRVLGIPGGRFAVTEVEPNLEDSYMWLMKNTKAEIKSP